MDTRKKQEEQEDKDTEDRQEQGYSLHIEQEEVNAERHQMHNERDTDDLETDAGKMPPDETKLENIDTEDAEREAGGNPLGMRRKKDGTGNDLGRPLK